MASNIHRISTAVWRQSQPEALELATIDRTEYGFVLHGEIVIATDPRHIRYDVFVDGSWRTNAAHIAVWQGDGARPELRLERHPSGRWSARRPPLRERLPLPQFDGAIDVDLGCTPATNLLPIRRFDLEVGESAETTAVWVQFPSLELTPLPQCYTRLSEFEYRYESFLSDFNAVLQVDAFGVVNRYEGFWERLNPPLELAP